MGYRVYQDKVTLAPMCAVSSPAWVFNGGNGLAAHCALNCAGTCALNVRDDSGFRAALFGGVKTEK